MFKPTIEYWDNKLKRLRHAIKTTQEIIPTLTEQRQIDAHISYLSYLKNQLAKDEVKFREWSNKQNP